MSQSIQPLIDQMFDGTITPQGVAALQHWLAEHPDHADRFVRQSLVNAHLRNLLVDRCEGFDDEVVTIVPADQPVRVATHRRWLKRVGTTVAAAAVLALVALGWFYTQMPPPEAPPVPVVSPLAMLTNMSDNAVFANARQPRTLGGELTADTITLSRGTAQVMFGSGAVVDLVGPCEFEVIENNKGRLHRGRLSALVRPEARGFTIDLPRGARLVDLGTAFTAQANELDETRVVVTEGRVRLTTPIQGTVRSRIVEAGAAARITARGIESIPGPDIRFAGTDLQTDGALRDLAVDKPLDADGDKVYGSDGFVYWNVTPIDQMPKAAGVREQPVDTHRRRSLPRYIERVVESPGTYTARDFDYMAIDHPADPPSAEPRRMEAGVLASPHDHDGRPTRMFTVRIGDDPPAGGFRLGLLINSGDRIELVPAMIRVESLTGGVDVSIAAAPDSNNGDMYFFDITDVSAGDELHIVFTPRDAGRPTVLSAVTFDPLPGPDPVSHNTPAGESRPGALAPTPVSDPVELQTTGPEKVSRKVRDQQGDN